MGALLERRGHHRGADSSTLGTRGVPLAGTGAELGAVLAAWGLLASPPLTEGAGRAAFVT